MIHYSCDLCKRELDPHHEAIYAVRMEVYPTCGTGAAIDNDRDHLEDIHEVLERFEEFDADGGVLPENDTYQKRRFDLCSVCCQRFLKEPLGRRGAAQFDFSKR